MMMEDDDDDRGGERESGGRNDESQVGNDERVKSARKSSRLERDWGNTHRQTDTHTLRSDKREREKRKNVVT